MHPEKESIPEFKREFSRNLTSNAILFVINIIVGLLIVPFYIHTLGLAAYGIIPLATSFSSYVMMVLDSLNAAISRFLTIRIHRSDEAGSIRIFNTALITITGLILLFTPVAAIVAWFAPEFFSITGVERNSVFFLFLLIFCHHSSVLSEVRSLLSCMHSTKFTTIITFRPFIPWRP